MRHLIEMILVDTATGSVVHGSAEIYTGLEVLAKVEARQRFEAKHAYTIEKHGQRLEVRQAVLQSWEG